MWIENVSSSVTAGRSNIVDTSFLNAKHFVARQRALIRFFRLAQTVTTVVAAPASTAVIVPTREPSHLESGANTIRCQGDKWLIHDRN